MTRQLHELEIRDIYVDFADLHERRKFSKIADVAGLYLKTTNQIDAYSSHALT